MKKLMTVIGLVLVMCMLVPVSCAKPTEVPAPAPAPPAPLKMPRPLVPAPAPTPTEESDLSFMTEMERQQWEERGIANVDSAELASILAEFPVVVPSYIPEVFQRIGKFMISNHNVGRPEGLAKFDWIEVQHIYSWQGEKYSDRFGVMQSSHKSGVGESTPFEICGKQGERHFSEVDSRLTFGWENDGMYFYITGLMLDHLDEEILEKIACSIGTEDG